MLRLLNSLAKMCPVITAVVLLRLIMTLSRLGAAACRDHPLRWLPVGPHGERLGRRVPDPRDRQLEYRSKCRYASRYTAGALLHETVFAFGSQVGCFLLPIQWAGGGLWCGTSGCGIGLSGGSSILQGDVTAGLTVAFQRSGM